MNIQRGIVYQMLNAIKYYFFLEYCQKLLLWNKMQMSGISANEVYY